MISAYLDTPSAYVVARQIGDRGEHVELGLTARGLREQRTHAGVVDRLSPASEAMESSV
jgi:hypothetical protein